MSSLPYHLSSMAWPWMQRGCCIPSSLCACVRWMMQQSTGVWPLQCTRPVSSCHGLTQVGHQCWPWASCQGSASSSVVRTRQCSGACIQKKVQWLKTKVPVRVAQWDAQLLKPRPLSMWQWFVRKCKWILMCPALCGAYLVRSGAHMSSSLSSGASWAKEVSIFQSNQVKPKPHQSLA